MQLTKKERKIKYLTYCGIIALFSLIQNVGGLWFEIGRARCFFLVPLCVFFSIGEDEKNAALLGLFAGVIWDAVAANHTAFNAVFLTAVCYIVSAMITHLFRDTYWVGIVMGCVATFVYCVLYWLFFVGINKDGASAVLFKFYFPSFLYTSTVSLVLNIFVIKIRAKLNKE